MLRKKQLIKLCQYCSVQISLWRIYNRVKIMVFIQKSTFVCFLNIAMIYVKIKTIVITNQDILTIYWNMRTRGIALEDTDVLWYVYLLTRKEENLTKKGFSAAETAEEWGCSHRPLKVYKTWKSNESSFGEPLNNHRQSKYLSNHQKLRPIGRSHILLFNNCFDNFFLIVFV